METTDTGKGGHMRGKGMYAVNALLGILVAVFCLQAADLVTLAARSYSGKDAVWINRFTSTTMALTGNHKVISGNIWYDNFPESGTFKIVFTGVTYKSQGRNPNKIYIGGTKVYEGYVPCNNNDNCRCLSSCGDTQCWSNDNNMAIPGEFTIQAGDQIKYWAQSAYCAGLSKAGSYASFKSIKFTRVGGGGDPTAPVTDITSPADGAELQAGSDITLAADGESVSWSYDAASDGKGRVDIGTGNSVPFTVPTDVSDPMTIHIYADGSNGSDDVLCAITGQAVSVFGTNSTRSVRRTTGLIEGVYGLDGTRLMVRESAPNTVALEPGAAFSVVVVRFANGTVRKAVPLGATLRIRR
jgi:hypothetical protein